MAFKFEGRGDGACLVEQIVEKSEGVFLYAERFCDEIRSGHLSLGRPEQFPQGLGGIFFQYFERQFPDLDQFRKDVRPALRAILAARQPLPVAILQRPLTCQDEELRDFTRNLGSLFPVINDPNGEVVKPYHKSLADWLADETKAGPYFVSVLEGHRILANQLQQLVDGSAEVGDFVGGPLSPDLALSEGSRVGELTPVERDYTLSHLAFHLYAAHRYSELDRLVRKSWLHLQTAHGRGRNAFLRDISFAIRAATVTVPSLELARSVVRVWRGAYASASVRDMTGWDPPRVVTLLAQAGRTAQASAFAELVPDAFLRCLCFCSIAEAEAQQRNGRTVAEAVRHAFTAVAAETRVVPRAQGLAKVAVRALEAGENQVLAAIDSLSEGETGHWMGSVLSDLSDAAVPAVRPDLLRRLLAVSRKIPKDDFNLNNTLVETLTSISMAMGRLRMSAEISQILSEALSMPDDTYHRRRLLTSLIDAFAVAGDLPTVTSIVDTVVEGASLEVQVAAYSRAANAYHDLGQELKAESVLDGLRSEVDATLDAPKRDAHLSELARAWSRIGRYNRAIDAAESIHKPHRRSDALRSVGRNALAANDLAQARDAAIQSLEVARLVDLEDFDAIHLLVETVVHSAEFLWDTGLRTEAITAVLPTFEEPRP